MRILTLGLLTLLAFRLLRLSSCEVLGPDSFVLRVEAEGFMHFHDVDALERFVTSAPSGRQVFHEYIRKGQLQKIKLDLDGNEARLAKYPDPLLIADSAPSDASAAARLVITSHRLPVWRDMTRLTGSPIRHDDIFVANSSNRSKWSVHIILPTFFVNGAAKVRKFTDNLLQLPFLQHFRASGILDEGVNKNIQNFHLAGFHKRSDPSRVKVIRTSHSWRDSLITFIEPGDVELYPYLKSSAAPVPVKVPDSPSAQDLDQVVKLVVKRFPFLAFHGCVAGRDDYDHLYPSLCDVCNSGSKHTSDNMYSVWRGAAYYLHCYRASDTAEPIKIFEVSAKKLKPPSRAALLAARLSSQSSRRGLYLWTSPSLALPPIPLRFMRMSDLKTWDGSLATVLILSGRHSLAHGQKALFAGFELYLDHASVSFSLCANPRLIISPESLYKIDSSGYDVIVLDEFETITQNFSGLTMRKPALCHNIYKSLLHDASLVLALDVSLDTSGVTHLQDLALIGSENSCVHWNRYLRNQREARFYISNNRWNSELLGSLESGLKVYIPMFSSPETALALHQKLESLGFRGHCFTKLLSEVEKKETFADINSAVRGLDYLIATPVMTCGINITVAGFDVAFAHFRTNAGIFFYSAYQMLYRVQILCSQRVHILTDLRRDSLPVFCEDLLAFIAHCCNYAKFPKLEEAHCERILTTDGHFVLKLCPA
ncbi:hypothetical protein GLOIN_2v1484426 [Rhizophagus irregularis DAOM 181602=DAOM 197198]|uniref:Replication origin-binding protein domain-containing protein n=1 Tax=Rhizophagus irregularis (strain DAOM 181602 / DAOM 197198 / MUCL 43194) TaxID=747089 RepID=A0A2P4PEI6_RHIID|nr:hypothetical protein GLOIN_2v1484426 [Rhizophagus irregularis DAOM 181602=DAOM 197198]POG63787.1 hypothetical protein GLOIN_2v1484426 [Rhizophagus irregularis DAOM 181602=DAOM 197198]|eukprot:XP_025170653.1 hypothetical protein GLOIN_2v1484426 [Rhizophagus irregularis DAOM 181602=DAOM 197198]